MFSKHNIIFLKYALFSLVMLLLAACRDEEIKIPAPDVSHIQADVEVRRFDKELMAMDTSNLEQELEQLRQSYPEFFKCYTENMLRLGIVSDTTHEYKEGYKELMRYGGFYAAYDSTMKRYDDISEIEQELEQAFKYYKYYFPDRPMPEIVTFYSEYSYGVISCGDSVIGIGLDLFLGEDFPFYPQLGIPMYLIPKFKQEYIVPNVMKSLAMNIFGDAPAGNNLLSHMIYNGKILYFLDLVMPNTPDHLKIGYTEDQIEWLRDNEGEVWAFFLGQNLLYESSMLVFNKFVREGPSTPGLPMEAPGNVGSWLGWQIIRKYMSKYENLTYDQLMANDNAQEILEKSNYKPKRN